MYIQNMDEVISHLRTRFRDYLEEEKIIPKGADMFSCYAHKDDDPSMHFVPGSDEKLVYCFGCKQTHDIFSTVGLKEGLPTTGPEWVTVTVPYLAEKFDIEIQTAEPTEEEIERIQYFKLAREITDVLSAVEEVHPYVKERGWDDTQLVLGSIAMEDLIDQLAERGWAPEFLATHRLLQTSKHEFFGPDKITFAIKDQYGKPISFITRNVDQLPKYIGGVNNPFYSKRKLLIGLDIAIKNGAKENGIILVEGTGDVAQMHKAGILNVAACAGTAITEEHLLLIKQSGIGEVVLNLDWDKAGLGTTKQLLMKTMRKVTGLSVYVKDRPEDALETELDPDEYLKAHSLENYQAQPPMPAFDWLMAQMDGAGVEELTSKLIPLVAAEPTAVRRELLTQRLVAKTGLGFHTIETDVESIRNSTAEQRNEKIRAAIDRYAIDAKNDPGNMQVAFTAHEEDIRHIEQEFERDLIGPGYQLSKFNALEERKRRDTGLDNPTEFVMNAFPEFQKALSNGADWTEGALMYVGGRANSGKTATVIHIGVDIALSDPEAIVCFHFTDDSYGQIEPRLITTVASMIRPSGGLRLEIGHASNPRQKLQTRQRTELYNQAASTLRNLLRNEKIVILDKEDGSSLSTLERNLKYIRKRHPNKKLMVICDNTHNYMDFLNLDQRVRMTRISDLQKYYTGHYRCCVMATVEYRKNQSSDPQKIRLPEDDDIADSRSLTYRPNLIMHVYNDLHDRKQWCEIFWTDPLDPGLHKPRLLLTISKNKLSGFKDDLVLDLDPRTVTCKQKSSVEAEREFDIIKRRNEDGGEEVGYEVHTGYR